MPPPASSIELTRTSDKDGTDWFLFWLDSAHTIERLAHCPFLDTPQKRQWFVDSYCGGYESLKCSGGLNGLGSIIKQLIDDSSGGAMGQISRVLLIFDAVTLNWNAICANEFWFAAACRNKVFSWSGISKTTGIDMTPLRNRYGFMISDGLPPNVYPLNNSDSVSVSVFDRGSRLAAARCIVDISAEAPLSADGTAPDGDFLGVHILQLFS